MLPPVATVIPFYLVMRSLGLLDTHLALILLNATFVLPFVVVIMRQTFLDLPVELEEAALVDGAGHWAAFWRIALPLAAPAIAATGPDHLRLHLERVPVRADDRHRQTSDHGAGRISPVPSTRAACSSGSWAVRAMIAMVPPVLIALIAQRYIVRGLTLGAVKG